MRKSETEAPENEETETDLHGGTEKTEIDLQREEVMPGTAWVHPSPSCSHGTDGYLKYSFYTYALVSFSSVFMLNKCPNALKVHTYDQVIRKNYYRSSYCILKFLDTI